jgi:hypothetical protein
MNIITFIKKNQSIEAVIITLATQTVDPLRFIKLSGEFLSVHA